MTDGDRLIAEFVAGRFVNPDTGRPIPSPVRRVEIAPTLDGAEAELVASVGLGGKLAVVCDANTEAALGDRVARALRGAEKVVLDHPKADEATLALLAERTRGADALIAVGSGTLNDLCKHVGFKDGRPCAVFATAASMNGYVTNTASITDANGFKLSLPSQAPRGVFCDLAVLAAAPVRMTRAGIGDALCRSSAQLDWLLSHILLGTPYSEAGYVLQAPDEPILLDSAGAATRGDHQALATLFRVLTLGAFGVCVIGTSHPGSMGEHSISHYVDMFAKPHPGTLHGEQVGVATRTMTHLQEAIVRLEVLPALRPTVLDEADMRRRYGPAYDACRRAALAKALDAATAAALSERLADEWGGIRARLRALMLPLARLDAVMESAGLIRSGEGLGLDRTFWQEAVGHAHEIRDRFSFLDLAWHTGLLEPFVEGER